MKTMCGLLILFSPFLTAGERSLSGNLIWDLSAAAGNDSAVHGQAAPMVVKEKKNPFLSGLYSLAVPGSGQYNSERYTKAAIFFAAEVALVTFAVINQNNGDKKTREFQKYADAHWSAVRYAKWIGTYGVSDYGPNAAFTQADYDAVGNDDYNKVNAWESGELGSHSLGFSHQLPRHGEQQYYELIGKYNQFKFGWDQYEVNGVTASANGGIPPSDNKKYDSYIPKQMQDYARERGKANDYYYAASFAVSAIVINHVISAVDAFISTNSYNHDLTASLEMRPVDSYDGTRLLSELTVSVGF